MKNYILSLDAEQDLKEIAHYTLRKWDKGKYKEYRNGLETKISSLINLPFHKCFSVQFTDLFVTKYRYHFIFYFLNDDQVPLIIGVIHEQRDIVNRLHERLI